MTIIQTPRLLLRELTDADHEALFEMYQDPRMNRLSSAALPRPARSTGQKVRETWPAYYARHGFGLWATVRRDDGRLMGRCGLLSQEVDGERHVEVAYALAPEFWGQRLRHRGGARQPRPRVPHAGRAARHLPHPSRERALHPRGGAERDDVLEDGGLSRLHLRVYRITRAEWEKRRGSDDAGLDAAAAGRWNTGTKDLDTSRGVGYFDTRFFSHRFA